MIANSRFCESYDGAKIAYQIYGNRKNPTIFLTNGIGCHQIFVQHLIDDLAKHFRVVFWHYRGHMDSPPPKHPDDWTVDMCINDMVAVMDASKTKKAVLAGFSMGVQLNNEFYRQHKERVMGIVNISGPYEYPINTLYYVGEVWKRLFPPFHKLVKVYPRTFQKIWNMVLNIPWAFPMAGILFFDASRMPKEDFKLYQKHFAEIDLDQFLGMAVRLNEHSTADILQDIKVPTLIVTGTHDNFTPLELNQKMVALIPGSELFTIPGGTHATLLEYPDLVSQRVIAFCKLQFGAKKKSAARKKAS